MYMYVFVSARLVAAATIRERRLFRSALAQVRLLFESGVYSREASIRSYTVYEAGAYLECARHIPSQLLIHKVTMAKASLKEAVFFCAWCEDIT